MGFLFWIVLSIVAIILNYRLAKNKGRSVAGWIIGSVLIGLFSTVILAVLPTKKPMKPCPYCTTKIPVAAIRCPQCQADLDLVSDLSDITNSPLVDITQKNIEPIRGWLILCAILVWFTPFFYLLYFARSIYGIVTFPSAVFMTSLSGGGSALYLLLDVILGLIGIVLSIIQLALFMKRKTLFINLSIGILIFFTLIRTVAEINVSIDSASTIAPYIVAIVYITYLLRSKRVKRTFVF